MKVTWPTRYSPFRDPHRHLFFIIIDIVAKWANMNIKDKTELYLFACIPKYISLFGNFMDILKPEALINLTIYERLSGWD